MSWVLVLIAALFEVVWAIGLKHTEGFTRLWPSAVTVLALILSFALLGLGSKNLPISTAYAVWTGVGTAGTAVIGICCLGETASAARLACICLILLGVGGLKAL